MTFVESIGAWWYHSHYVHRILAALIKDTGRTVLIRGGIRLTGGMLAKSILADASLLRRNGIGHGSVVAILTQPNHPIMLTVRYAAHLLGATTVCIRSDNARSDDRMLPADDQARMLAETGACLLVADSASAERARALCQNLACSVAETELRSDATGEVAAELGREASTLPAPGYGPRDSLVITYTSGSTGRPKGVRHSYAAWNNIVTAVGAATAGTAHCVFLAVTPIAQTVALMLDGTLASGGSVVVLERFSVDGVLHAFDTLGVTHCYLAVPHLYALVEDSRLARTDLSRLRQVVYSGSPATPHRVARAAEVFGPALIQSYGSTEGGPITILGPADHRDPALLPTVGRPYPGVRVRVCDGDPGNELPPGRTGEIWIRSRNVMDGYVNNPELTAQVLRDGWLRTGDLGHWDERGYLRLTGRIGHVIKSGGLKVYPATIEQALLSHNAVDGAAVFAVRNRDDIEDAYAAVTMRPGLGCTIGDLREHLAAVLSPAHVPATIARWADLPVDASGKTDYRRLRALVEAGSHRRDGLLVEG